MPVTCLIVDDNREFLRVARDLLEREGIAVVATVSTAAQARCSSRELHPEVALVDIDLGAENGFDVARELTSDPDIQPPRVILISAYGEDDFADLIADSPAISFLSKAALSAAAIWSILASATGGAD
jgi:CheY-like chemotaxis protein